MLFRSPIKNCSSIARALSLLNSGLRYIAVGRDCGDLQLIREICMEGGVEFKHYSMISEEDKFELIKNSAMLVYPQQSEFIGGLSPFEAMYCGKPVIVSNFKVLKDLYGDNARYFLNWVPDLAKEISFVNNLKKEVFRQDLIRANEHSKRTASFDVMSKKILEIFRKMKK